MADQPDLKVHHKRLKLTSWSGALLLAGSLLLLNYIVSFVSLRLDTSEGRIYSLAPGSKQILKNLEDTVLIQLYFSSQLPPQFKINEQYIRDLLAEYKSASGGKIRLEYLDPAKSDKVRQEAIQSGISPVQLNVRERGRLEVKECFMGMAINYGDQSEAVAFIQETDGLEYEISQRLKKLVFPGQATIGVVTNGGAMTFSSDTVKELKPLVDQQYNIREVNLAENIPTDLKSLWLLGPEAELSEEDASALKAYVEGGGILGLLLDRFMVELAQFRVVPKQTGLESLLSEWGLNVRSGMVVDPQSDRIQIRTQQGYFSMVNIIDYPYFPLATQLDRSHPVVKGVDGISFPFVSPVVVEKDLPNLSYNSLAKSSEHSWLDPIARSISPLERHTKPENAESGPFDLGMIVEGKFADGEQTQEGRLILFGSSKFIRTDYPPRQANFSVFLNLLDWSAQDEYLLSIRSKGSAARPLKKMSDTTRLLVKYSMILLLPIVSVLVGLFFWRRQKLRRYFLQAQYKGI